MAIFDVVVNTDDLVVLGPPDIIDLAISIGEQGVRGATFYAGSGSPNEISVSQNIFGENITPVAGDIFINTAIGPEYGWLYIYNPKVVGNQWDQVLKLQKPFYAIDKEATFDEGLSSILIPLSDIITSGAVESDPNKYIVSLTANASNPVVITINQKIINSSSLQLDLEAIKYIATPTPAWSALDETINLYIHIAVI